MKIGKKNYTTIWYEDNFVKIIDQTLLPFKLKIKNLRTVNDFFLAIKNMQVRGAPLIGVTAAYGLMSAIKKNNTDSYIISAYKKLLSARPTAVNLKWALDLLLKIVLPLPKEKRWKRALEVAENIRFQDIKNCKKIGLEGLKIIKNKYKKKKRIINILTHCNAGWLATVDWGTALSPIFFAKQNNIPIHVWVDETRPRNQGALLTAWELKNAKIPYTIIVDNAGGHLMQCGKVDLCLVGSDRTALNGDVCNKIGTYLKAVAAFENNIPFYVALPTSTIDANLNKGVSKIDIEERSPDEITKISSSSGKSFDIYFRGSNVANPAFDVTPNKYITGLITENGTLKARYSDLKKIKKIVSFYENR